MIIEFSMHCSALYMYVGVVCVTTLHYVLGTIPTDLTFKVNRLIQCPQPESRFRFLLDVSIKECVYECVLRFHCKGVAYRRSFTLCELHTDRDGPLKNDRDDGGCVFVARNDISTQSIQSVLCQTDELQAYDPDTGTCSYKGECFPFKLDNGTIFGNTNNVGARKKVECSPGYHEATGKTSTQCQDTGKWEYIPLCIKPIYLGEQCFLTWSTYNVQLCDDTTAQCTVATPTGNTVCQCPDDYYDNNGGDVGGSCVPMYPADGWIHPSDNAAFQIKIYTDDTKDQAGARLACEVENAKLVKLDDESKFNFIRTILTQSQEYEGMNFWTDGMSDASGVWYFSDNSYVPLDEAFWDHLHDKENECLILEESAWLWKHKKCDENYYFVCEKWDDENR